MKQEVSLLRNLSHPNIVQYFQTDLNKAENSINVLLEYVPGGTLKSILQKYHALEVAIIKNYSRQLLSGLSYLHANKIVHRDLKSANVLVSSNGIIKLTDLGSSKILNDFDKTLSRSLKGSPYWIAPEVVLRLGHSFSADIWSFGCVLIEMVSGLPPWYNYSKDTKEVLNLISTEGCLPDIPDTDTDLRIIIVACLNRNPLLRPTAEQLQGMNFFQCDTSHLERTAHI